LPVREDRTDSGPAGLFQPLGSEEFTAVEHGSTLGNLQTALARLQAEASFDDLLEWLLARVCALAQARSASLHLLNEQPNEQRWIALAARRGPDGTIWVAQRARPPFRGGTTEQICRDPHPIIRNRLAGGAPVHPALIERHIQATLHVPVLSGGRLIGVLNAESVQPDCFTDEHVQRLTELARQVAPALERAWLLHQSGAAKLRERRLLAEVQRLRGTIVELRGALEQYRSLVDPAQDMLVTIDRTLRIGFISAQAQQMLGYRPEELVGQPIEVLLDPHEHAAVRQHLEAALAGEPVPAIDLVHLRRRDGSVLEVEVHGANIYSDGQIVGRHYVVRDVTARWEEQRQQSQAERLRVLGQMASGAAHQLNNLLAHIMGQAEVALLHLQGPSPDPAQVATLLETIVQLVDEGSQVIRRMQEFSRVRRDAPATDPVDLASVLHEAIELTRPRWKDEAEAAGVRVEFILRLPEPRRVAGARDMMSLPVAGNPAELREAIANLLLNALEAMPQGGTIEITGEWLGPATAPQVCLQVRDTGVGMDPTTLRRLFEPFFTTKHHGTGLGLAMTYGIITRHGGTIEAQSAGPGQGSTFTITLPGLVIPSSELGSGSDTGGASVPAARVIVVDDEPGIVDFAVQVLTAAGHHVSAFTSPEEAVQEAVRRYAAGNRVDLIITDLSMPERNGWWVAQTIKQLDPRIPVVLATGWNMEVRDVELASRGVDGILAKPFRAQELRALVRQHVRTAKVHPPSSPPG
jgi:PAS domain S-box-containing protein